MNSIRLYSKPNVLGAFASILCLIHCFATPFLLGFLDLIFLSISFIAIWWSVKTTTKNWMRYALWLSWFVLAIVIFNEKLGVFPLLEEAIYVPSTALIFLHFYNKKYCNCGDTACCVDGKLEA